MKNLSQEPRLQGGTPQRLWFTFDKFKSSIKNKRGKLNSQWKFNILSVFKWGYKEYLNQNLIKILTKLELFFPKNTPT